MLKAILIILHVIVSLALIAFVLLQSGHAAGLSGAVAGAGERLFGKKKGLDEQFARFTTIAAVGFFITALVLTVAGK
ncbi:MAG: preprotein translocase subunit SecG [Chloroflexota bacterium]